MISRPFARDQYAGKYSQICVSMSIHSFGSQFVDYQAYALRYDKRGKQLMVVSYPAWKKHNITFSFSDGTSERSIILPILR